MRPVFCPPLLPAAARPAVVASIVAIVALSLAACSSAHQASYQDASWAGAQPSAPMPQRQTAYEPQAGDPIQEAPIEPQGRPQPMPDDPNEPFSPNYGGPRPRPPVQLSGAVPSPHDPQPDAQPVSYPLPEPSRAYFRRVTTTASAD